MKPKCYKGRPNMKYTAHSISKCAFLGGEEGIQVRYVSTFTGIPFLRNVPRGRKTISQNKLIIKKINNYAFV